MNITFLIGNGFDRNLGLNTTYSDFVKYYKGTIPANSTLEKFRNDISENEELWSNAELALGQYTGSFNEGEGALFSECQADFCEYLAHYLKEEEERIDFASVKEKVKKAFARLNKLYQSFPTEERNVFSKIYQAHNSERTIFNFITFNYTSCLDRCLEIVKNTPGSLGSHSYAYSSMSHDIGRVCHVHGTITKEMVFAVNDDSQIAKPSIFNCENGDIFKNLLIKKQANATYLENTDNTAAEILASSDLIYVYGMSIGDTDNLWWERICNWLNGSSSHHLILQKYSIPAKSVIPVKYQLFEREQRKSFSAKSKGLNERQRESIESRIHIPNENIFEDISKVASPQKNHIDNLSWLA